MVISFDELLKIGTCTIAKTNTDLRESATNSVHYATPFGHCEWTEIFLLGMFTARQTHGN